MHYYKITIRYCLGTTKMIIFNGFVTRLNCFTTAGGILKSTPGSNPKLKMTLTLLVVRLAHFRP